MVLDATLLNTRHYKLGKVDQSSERSNAPILHLGVVAIRVAFDKGRQLHLFLYLNIPYFASAL